MKPARNGYESREQTDCPTCRDLIATILANPTSTLLSLTNENPTLRALAERVSERALSNDAEVLGEHVPPDGYAVALRRRAQEERLGGANLRTLGKPPDLSETRIDGGPIPPNPYEAGLRALRERDRC